MFALCRGMDMYYQLIEQMEIKRQLNIDTRCKKNGKGGFRNKRGIKYVAKNIDV
jgi:hypothetical protein